MSKQARPAEVNNPYDHDLAYVHEAGFASHANEMARALLPEFTPAQPGDLMVDLGCGPGHWTKILSDAGFACWGVDLSPAMIALAKKRDPKSVYACASFLDVELPACRGITALGEVLNYTFDRRNSGRALRGFFRRVWQALRPGGIFAFDIAEPDRHTAAGQSFRDGPDWTVLVSYEHDFATQRLKRKIVTFRKVRETYRRADEVHTQQLFVARDLCSQLRELGFRAMVKRKLGEYALPEGVAAIIARRPMK